MPGAARAKKDDDINSIMLHKIQITMAAKTMVHGTYVTYFKYTASTDVRCNINRVAHKT